MSPTFNTTLPTPRSEIFVLSPANWQKARVHNVVKNFVYRLVTKQQKDKWRNVTLQSSTAATKSLLKGLAHQIEIEYCQYPLTPYKKFARWFQITYEAFATGFPANIQENNLSEIPLKNIKFKFWKQETIDISKIITPSFPNHPNRLYPAQSRESAPLKYSYSPQVYRFNSWASLFKEVRRSNACRKSVQGK
jgi:hypothetical protein